VGSAQKSGAETGTALLYDAAQGVFGLDFMTVAYRREAGMCGTDPARREIQLSIPGKIAFGAFGASSRSDDSGERANRRHKADWDRRDVICRLC